MGSKALCVLPQTKRLALWGIRIVKEAVIRMDYFTVCLLTASFLYDIRQDKMDRRRTSPQRTGHGKDGRDMKAGILRRFLAGSMALMLAAGGIYASAPDVFAADVEASGTAETGSTTEPQEEEQETAEESSAEAPETAEGLDKTNEAVPEAQADEAGETDSASQSAQTEEADPNAQPAQTEDADTRQQAVGFEQSEHLPGVTVRVMADTGVFPKDAVLSVRECDASEQESVEEAVEKETDNHVAVAYSFDIKVLDTEGKEIEPNTDAGRVIVSFEADEVANPNLTAEVYHVTETNASEYDVSKLQTETDESTVTAETDGFSYYTVEFTYKELRYVMPGDSEMPLATILDAVGLQGNVKDAKSGNDELFSVEEKDGVWTVTAKQAFSTEEKLTVTLEDGIEYEILVTDDVSDISPDVVNVTNIQELLDIAKKVNNGITTYEDKILHLKSSIDLSGTTWIPIGTMTHPFKGSFDGENNTINGLSKISSSDAKCYGLFGNITSSKSIIFKNIRFENVNVNTRGTYYGSIAGRITMDSNASLHLENCYENGKIVFLPPSEQWSNAYAGGFVGVINQTGANSVYAGNMRSEMALTIDGYAGYDDKIDVGGIWGYSVATDSSKECEINVKRCSYTADCLPALPPLFLPLNPALWIIVPSNIISLQILTIGAFIEI